MNISKINDPRAWRTWGKSGALQRLPHALPSPAEIDTSQHFWDSFGQVEREISARWIVRLCQLHGSWRPFTFGELQEFYASRLRSKSHDRGFTFNGLDASGYYTFRRGDRIFVSTPQYIEVDKDGRYRVTEAFIRACYESSPAYAYVA